MEKGESIKTEALESRYERYKDIIKERMYRICFAGDYGEKGFANH